MRIPENSVRAATHLIDLQSSTIDRESETTLDQFLDVGEKALNTLVILEGQS